jgi:hypothetical protein
MSIATCTECCDLVDTDQREMWDLDDDRYVCEKCLDKYPELLAEVDFAEGKGLDDCPYPYDIDPFSKCQRWLWSMHRQQIIDLSEIHKRVN